MSKEIKKQEKCPGKSEVAIPWAGKIMKGCRKHARAMNILGNVMGSPIECRELPPNNDPCEFNNDLEKND